MKIFKIQIIAIYFLIFVIHASNAQINYKPGIIIKNNNDTLKGAIELTSEQACTEECIFREFNKTEVVSYKPAEIKGYMFSEGKTYLSKKITLNKVEKDIFLELLVSGETSLYYFKGFNDFFVVELKDGNLVVLTNSESTIQSDGRNYVKKLEEYKGQLFYLLRSCRDVQMMIKDLNFNHSSMIALFQKYNSCIGSESKTYFKPSKSVMFKFGGTAGYCHSQLKYSNYNFGFFKDDYLLNNSAVSEKIITSSSPEKSNNCLVAGLFANAVFSKMMKNLSLQIELLYISQNTYKSFSTGIYTETVAEDSVTSFTIDHKVSNNVNYKFTTVSIPLLFRYNLSNKSKLRPFVDLGVAADYLINSRIDITREIDGKADYSILTPKGMSKFTILAGIGTQINLSDKRSLYVITRYTREGISKSQEAYILNSFNISTGINF